MTGNSTAERRRRSRTRLRRGPALGAGLTLAVGAGVLGFTPPAKAEGNQIFNLSSEAVAVQSTFTDPGVPLGLPFSVGSYGASSLLNSNGESAADAGAPYSPLLSSMPKTGNGVAHSTFGTALPVVPTFPGYVTAKDPVTPLARQNAGGYELVAAAEPGAARGTVNMGVQSATATENNAFAFAHSVAEADEVRSEASAGVHALTLDGILDLANFSSYASLKRAVDGATVPFTRTDLGTVSFAGLTSGMSGAGFSALGSEPAPLSVDGLDAFNEALEPAGITLTYLPETYTYTDGSTSTGPVVDEGKVVAGLVSGALQIFMSHEADRGTTTETITIGRVAVNATSTTVEGSGTAPAARPDPSDVAVGLPPTVDSPAPATSAPALPGVAAAVVPDSGLVGAAPATALPTRYFAPAASFRIDPQGITSFDSVYVILALAAGMTLLGGQVVRLVAVKLR